MGAEADLGESTSARVVLITPTRRDAEVTTRLLDAQGIETSIAANLRDAESLVSAGAGALIVTDKVLADFEAEALWRLIESQPAWSKLPVIALCHDGNQSRLLDDVIGRLGNVTVLERPTSIRTVLSTVRAALRGRRWQYQIRDQIRSLEGAEKALRQADSHKNLFLATLAHELRNPLAPIRAGLELTEGTDLGREEMQKIHAMMARQLRQLVHLIDELLDISRISTGKVRLDLADVDLRRSVTSAVESCQPLLDSAGHALLVDMPDRAVRVVGDEVRLSQLLANLLNNAIKYTAPGGDIGLALSVQGGQALITVSDTGIGIPDHMLEHVFEMFAQVDGDLDRSRGGLGLGLALVRNLVGLHGGTVSASSEGTGKGSTFRVTLPLSTAEERRPASEPPVDREAPRDDTAAVAPLRILVVDDNRDAADMLGTLLGTLNHAIQVAYDGKSGIGVAMAWHPQVVFCDIGMPEMDGLQVAAVLRQQAELSDLFLVALTGWGGEEDRRLTADAGFDSHLVKPCTTADLRSVLAQVSRPTA